MLLHNLLISFIALVVKIIAFGLSWQLAALWARRLERFPRDILSGIFFTNGFFFYVIICFLITGAGFYLRNFKKVSLFICASLFLWSIYLAQAFESRPFAVPTFFILGAVILLTGSRIQIARLR